MRLPHTMLTALLLQKRVTCRLCIYLMNFVPILYQSHFLMNTKYCSKPALFVVVANLLPDLLPYLILKAINNLPITQPGIAPYYNTVQCPESLPESIAIHSNLQTDTPLPSGLQSPFPAPQHSMTIRCASE